MIGYKATDLDGKCRGFQFEVGKTYTKNTKKEDMKCCTDTVFHFCRELHAIEKESNYIISKSRLFEVIAGDYVRDGDKYGTNSLTILREIKGEEKEELLNSGKFNSGNWNSGKFNSGDCNSGNCNSGNWNSGKFNSGDCNSGNCNSGDFNSGNFNSGNRNYGNFNSGDCNSGNRNSGNRNSGNWNSGDFNSGDFNSGYFNIDTPLVRIFGKETEIKRKDINFPNWLFFDLNVWVSHDTATDEEKEEHKQEITACGGFLKVLNYKEAFKFAYDKADDEGKIQLFKLPNFDKEIFEKISGIDVTEDYEKLMKE